MGPGTCQGGGGATATCHQDTDCTGTNARCDNDGPVAGCHCAFDACAQDTDCASAQLCACHGSPGMGGNGNSCMPSNCRVDSDCGASSYCSPSVGGCGALQGYYCHTALDTCVDDTDCPQPAGASLPACNWSAADTRWECTGAPICG